MQTPKVKRIQAPSLQIDSALAYKTSLKRHYKTVHRLDFEVFHSIFGVQTRSKLINRKLLKITKHTKSINHLNLPDCVFATSSPLDSHFLALTKSLPHLRGLHIVYNGTPILVAYRKWIAQLKFLKSFSLIFRTYVRTPMLPKEMEVALLKFLKALKTKKQLKELNILLEANHHAALKSFLKFGTYCPTSLQSFSFLWNGYGPSLSSLTLPKSETSLHRLKDLQSLTLRLPTSMEVFKDVMGSVPETCKVEALRLGTNSLAVEKIAWLKQAVVQFQGLSKVYLKLKAWSKGLPPCLEALKTCPVEDLRLDLTINHADNLKGIGELIRELPRLQNLALRLMTSEYIEFQPNESFKKLFAEISRLKNLRVLKLYFVIWFSMEDDEQTGFMPALSDCVKKLPNLEELSIRFRQGDIPKHYGSLLSSLMDKAQNLKKLRLNFAERELTQETLSKLVELLKGMKNVRKISLDELCVQNHEWFETLAVSLCSLKRLETLKLEKLTGESDVIQLLAFLKAILIKQQFRKVKVTPSPALKFAPVPNLTNKDKIDLRRVLDKNPRLKMAYVSLDVYVQETEVAFCKWN